MKCQVQGKTNVTWSEHLLKDWSFCITYYVTITDQSPSQVFSPQLNLWLFYLSSCFASFFRKYGTRCARCGRNIHSTDWVRRARGSTFHLACFSCTSCKRQLSTGEECGLLENRVFCRTHYDIMMENIKHAKENGEYLDVMNTRAFELFLTFP